MTMLTSQITSLTVVYLIVYSGVNQRKHQSSASLAIVREIHRGPVNFPHKWPVTRKIFPFDDVIMISFVSHQVMLHSHAVFTLNDKPGSHHVIIGAAPFLSWWGATESTFSVGSVRLRSVSCCHKNESSVLPLGWLWGNPDIEQCSTHPSPWCQRKIFSRLNREYYGGPEGTSLHKFFIALHKFWLVWKKYYVIMYT